MEAITLLTVIALGWKVLDFFKYLTAKEYKSASTQAAAWIIMILAVWVFAQSDFSATTVINDISFKSLNMASIVLLGFMYGSGAGAIVSVVRAIDNTDSAKTPPLIPKGDE